MLTTLAMLTLAAEDWYETFDFYREVLGMPVLWCDEPANRARLRASDGVVLEIVSGGWGADGPKSARENPFSLSLRVQDLERLVPELEARGAAFLTEPDGGVVALMDPEGNRLFLYDTPEPPPAPDGWEHGAASNA